MPTTITPVMVRVEDRLHGMNTTYLEQMGKAP